MAGNRWRWPLKRHAWPINQCKSRLKSEIRNPKSETNPKSEFQNSPAERKRLYCCTRTIRNRSPAAPFRVRDKKVTAAWRPRPPGVLLPCGLYPRRSTPGLLSRRDIPTIAQRFSVGCGGGERSVPQGRLNVYFQPSLRDLGNTPIASPTLKRWAIVGMSLRDTGSPRAGMFLNPSALMVTILSCSPPFRITDYGLRISDFPSP